MTVDANPAGKTPTASRAQPAPDSWDLLDEINAAVQRQLITPNEALDLVHLAVGGA